MTGGGPGIPAALQIGPHDYTIVVDADRAAELEQDAGASNYLRGEIVLHPRQSPTQLRDTLLHECLHMLLATAGTHTGSPPLLSPGGDEERLVSALTPLLLDTLKRNPELVAFLTAPTPALARPRRVGGGG